MKVIEASYRSSRKLQGLSKSEEHLLQTLHDQLRITVAILCIYPGAYAVIFSTTLAASFQGCMYTFRKEKKGKKRIS